MPGDISVHRPGVRIEPRVPRTEPGGGAESQHAAGSGARRNIQRRDQYGQDRLNPADSPRREQRLPDEFLAESLVV